jgi:hypothetical protein
MPNVVRGIFCKEKAINVASKVQVNKEHGYRRPKPKPTFLGSIAVGPSLLMNLSGLNFNGSGYIASSLNIALSKDVN